MTTGRTIALTIWTFIDKVMSLLLNTLSRFFHCFPAKKKSSSNFMVVVTITVILEPKKRKSVTTFTVAPSIYHEVMGPDAMI